MYVTWKVSNRSGFQCWCEHTAGLHITASRPRWGLLISWPLLPFARAIWSSKVGEITHISWKRRHTSAGTCAPAPLPAACSSQWEHACDECAHLDVEGVHVVWLANAPSFSYLKKGLFFSRVRCVFQCVFYYCMKCSTLYLKIIYLSQFWAQTAAQRTGMGRKEKVFPNQQPPGKWQSSWPKRNAFYHCLCDVAALGITNLVHMKATFLNNYYRNLV